MKPIGAVTYFIVTLVVLMTAPVICAAQGLGFISPIDSMTEETAPTAANDTAAVVDQQPPTQTVTDTAVVTPPADQAVVQPSAATAQFQATSSYNIRNANGDRLCTVDKGTPLTPSRLNSDKDFVKVSFSSSNCSVSEGWISINGLQPVGGTGSNMKVDVAGSLSLRSSPGSNNNWLCNLPKGTGVAVKEQMPATDRYRAWVKIDVANPPSGCPSEGWVHSEYLRADDSLLASLPVDTATVDYDDNSGSEAGLTDNCVQCLVNKNVSDLQAVVAGAKSLGETDWRRNRGLVQIPTRGSNGNVGPCGSFHYNPDHGSGGTVVDNYASPIAACVMMSLLQDWKSRYPSSSSGRRIQWGDISHKTKAKFNDHKTHTEGNCIDFRPMRTGGFDNSPLYRWDGAYDREGTREFIEMAYSKGASVVYFNDRKIEASRAGGHDNHVHICFPSNKTTRAVCRNYKYDENICGAQ